MREHFYFNSQRATRHPLKRRIKTEPRFLAHLNPTASELLDLSFLSELEIFCGCSADPPPRGSGTRV